MLAAFLAGCIANESLGELKSPELILTEGMVELRWQLEPSIVLQHAATLEGPWITVEGTRGKGSYETVRPPEGA